MNGISQLIVITHQLKSINQFPFARGIKPLREAPMNPLETYLKELSEIRSCGAAIKETSDYGCLANLLNEIP